MSKNAIVFGSGRIGRGLITQILIKNDYKVTHVDTYKPLVEELNNQKKYTIHVMGFPDKDTPVEDVEAIEITDYKKIAEAWDNAEYIFTAVGGSNLPELAKHIAEIYKLRTTTKASNIIICENWLNPANELSVYLKEILGLDFEKFEKNVGVSEAVVLTTGSGDPKGGRDTLDTWVQDFLYLPVNRALLKEPYTELKYLDYVDDFGNLLKQKIYTNNTSVASISYLGYITGHTIIPEAANDSKIEPILDEIYKEIHIGLTQGLGISEEKQIAFAKRAKKKYQDHNIVDQVIRVGRNPIRKLRIDDRLVGPALLCLEVGTEPKAIAFATAAALHFDADSEGVEINDYYKQHGVSKTLQKYSSLPEGHKFISLVEDADNRLEAWINE